MTEPNDDEQAVAICEAFMRGDVEYHLDEPVELPPPPEPGTLESWEPAIRAANARLAKAGRPPLMIGEPPTSPPAG